MTTNTFWNDPRLSDTAKGVGAYIADNPGGLTLDRILTAFRNPPLYIAKALDNLELCGYVERVMPVDAEPALANIIYIATPNLTGKAVAA